MAMPSTNAQRPLVVARRDQTVMRPSVAGSAVAAFGGGGLCRHAKAASASSNAPMTK